jgi:hypothetical protein
MVELTAPAEPHRIPVSESIHNKDIGWRFHLAMFVGCTFILLIILVCSIKAPVADWESKIEVASVVVIVSAVPAIFWHDLKEYVRRDAALALPWIFILMILLPVAAVQSARLQFPLRDALFVKVDLALGFNDPAIVAWCTNHWLVGNVLDHSYSLLVPLLASAILLPALLGQAEAAQKFVLANTIAFVGSFPLFAFLPAVGPWYGYHFPANEPQIVAETAIIALHSGAPTSQFAGVLTFPSFHVIWAALSALALCSIRRFRVFGVVIAVLVVVSTLTTGWHYAADLVAGLIVAGLSWLLADLVIRGRICNRLEAPKNHSEL